MYERVAVICAHRRDISSQDQRTARSAACLTLVRAATLVSPRYLSWCASWLTQPIFLTPLSTFLTPLPTLLTPLTLSRIHSDQSKALHFPQQLLARCTRKVRLAIILLTQISLNHYRIPVCAKCEKSTINRDQQLQG